MLTSLDTSDDEMYSRNVLVHYNAKHRPRNAPCTRDDFFSRAGFNREPQGAYVSYSITRQDFVNRGYTFPDTIDPIVSHIR